MMPLLQESQTGRDVVLSSRDTKMKGNEADDHLDVTSNHSLAAAFSGLHASSLLTPSHFLAASQTAAFMAASGLPVSLHATLSSNPALFHSSLFGTMWPTSPQSPPFGAASPISPNTRKNNNNNNVVSSSSGEVHSKPGRRKTIKKELVDTRPLSEIISASGGPLSPPTSGSSPPSSTGEPVGTGKEQSRDKQFTCGVCNRSFGYKHVLQNHERTHTGEKPFECPQCHKRFTRDHHLKTHMRLHTGEKPYHCSHCDRHFVQVANLRRHLRVHTGERPYQCEQCSARFSDTNQLKAHALIHKGEKPYQCERCRGRFRRKHHLMHHKCGNAVIESPLAGTLPNSVPSHSPNACSDDEDMPADLSHGEKIRERKSRDIRRVIRMPSVSPLITLPLHVSLPEQTEPEDLSMSTGHLHLTNHSHSSGDSPMSRSPPSSDNRDEEIDDDDLDEAATLFLKQKTKTRQQQLYQSHVL